MNLKDAPIFLWPTLPKLILFLFLGGYFSFFSLSMFQPNCPQTNCIGVENCIMQQKCNEYVGNPLPTYSKWNPSFRDNEIKYVFLAIDLAFWYLVCCAIIFIVEKYALKK